MSSTGSRTSRRSTRSSQRRGAAASAGGQSDVDLFSATDRDDANRGSDRSRSRAGGRNVEEQDVELEPLSGLRTSEVEPHSPPLSYSGSTLLSGSSAAMGRRSRTAGTGHGGVPDAPTTRNATEGPAQTDNSAGTQNVVIWGTEINIGQVTDRFRRFLLTFTTADLDNEAPLVTTRVPLDPTRPLYLQRLEDMAHSGATCLDVNCGHLSGFNRELYHQLVTYPREVIPALDAAAMQVYADKFREYRPEKPIKVRPFNCDQSRTLRSLGPDDLDQLVSVSGLVIRLSSIIPDMLRAVFRCAVCYAVHTAPCEQGRVLEPVACANCHAAHTCQLLHSRCTFEDKQLVKLQESPEDMPAGETPHTDTLYAHQELVDSIQPGDRVTVTGIYRAEPQRVTSTQRTLKAVYKTYIYVLHFKQESNERLRLEGEGQWLVEERVNEIVELSKKADLYERLSSAIAPSIYENEDVKKGILMQLFGGSKKDFSDVGRGHFRSDINILLCGDPGTSKSQLLQYVSHLVPRAQYTSGKGSSAVGLTAYVTKDPETRQVTLQTGALVLADNGVCCIDEFDKMSDSTRCVLHEVMEQQTLSLAKAGILCQLNARTSILAAANPVGSKWEAGKTIIDNIQLPHTLLSRFDLIFLILDPQDEIYDARLARHLVSLYYRTPEQFVEEFVAMELLRDYISYAKANYNPTLSEEAGQYLVEEYVEVRRLGSGRGQVSAYPRQLESLIRLAEAHARMRLSHRVTVDDCREARRLQREALKQAAIDPATGMIDVNILTTGVSSSMRKRREEMANAIWCLLEERGGVVTFSYPRVLEQMRSRSDRMITREMFEDGLNTLKNGNKIVWAGNTIRKR